MQCASGKTIVELPTFQMLDDSTLYGAYHTNDRALKTWKEEFDALYETGALVNLTLHARGNHGSRRASRVAVADQFGVLKGWDSLGHIALMMAVESEFGVALTTESMQNALTLPALEDFIAAAVKDKRL